jgi:hypothetical protein
VQTPSRSERDYSKSLTPSAPRSDSRLVDSLVEATKSTPTARKRLIGHDINYCRELLVTLARRSGGWIGWEPATLATVAADLAFIRLVREGLAGASDIVIESLIESALDESALDASIEAVDRHPFAALRGGLGFRRAVVDAVLELRFASVSPAELLTMPSGDNYACELSDILARYESALTAARLCDAAGVFSAAIEELDRPDARPSGGSIFLIPGISRRGLRGQLIDRLIERGAGVLVADSVADASIPASLLAAAADSPDNEGAAPLLSWIAASRLPDFEQIDSGAATMDLFSAATPTIEL